MRIRIEVPFLPPAETSPNWRGHWARRHRASKMYRQAVYLYVKDQHESLPAFKHARLDLTFVFAATRSRDEDNLRARFKPGQDALVDLGLIPDDNQDRLTMGAVNIEVDNARSPLTIIELTEEETTCET